MSGLYLPGMDLPTSCYKCYLKQRNGMDIVCPVTHERFSVADINILEYRLDSCPIVPVPEHGRLVDADALPWIEGRDEQDNPAYLLIKKCVDVLPTVIPASKEGET